MKSDKNILSGAPLLENWSYKSAAEYFLEKISENGRAIALIGVESGEQLSHSQVLEQSLKLAVSLDKLGLKVNDRIGICSENNLSYGVAILASIFRGTTLCPWNPLYKERELLHIMSISKPKYAFVSNSCLPKMLEIVKKLPWTMKLILLYPSLSNMEIPTLPGLITRISDSEIVNFKPPEIDPNNHVVVIASSSGTTGLPKGVMLTDKNIFSVIQCQKQDPAQVIKPDSAVLGLLPLFHAYAFFAFLISMASRTKMIVFSKFNLERLLEAVQKYKIDTLTLVPTVLNALIHSSLMGKYNVSSVKRIVCSGSPLSEVTARTIMALFNLPFISAGYGMTELTLSVTNSPATKHKLNSIGVLQPGVQAKIIPLEGESKEPLGPNIRGEMCFKTNSIMKGYFENEEATNAIIDEDGFLHTGDVGYYDEDGFFFIVDRVKDLIKYNSYQVAPAELEGLLLTHPAVEAAAVVGLPDDMAGELPFAFLVKKPGVPVTAEDIKKFIAELVSPQKQLRGGVRFIEKIPTNASGKILRRELREMLNKVL